VTLDPAGTLDELVRTGEELGAAVAVVRDGVVEVDHCAGTTDGVEPWRSDTLVMTFSVAKPFAALAFLDAVREGVVTLDQPVKAVWPEFAAQGKQAATMRHLLSHRAGLPVFPPEAAGVAYDDRGSLVALLAESAPLHPPGEGIAEHALTYGHLLDEVLRRAAGEPLAARFASVAGSAGWDLHLQVPDADLGRVADVEDPDGSWAGGYRDDPQWGPALSRPDGLLHPEVLNSSRFRQTAFPAVAMHAGALALALFYDDVRRPDGWVAERLGHDLWREYVEPAATGHDRVLDRVVTWTLGFQVSEEDGRIEMGMGGAGGCSAWTEPEARVGAAYVTRKLGSHERGEAVWESISERYRP